MNNKYDVRLLQDNIYGLYILGDDYNDLIFKGTIEQVNAYLSLEEKGFIL